VSELRVGSTYHHSRLSAFEIPKVFHFVKALPENATGKVDRRQLTKLLSS